MENATYGRMRGVTIVKPIVYGTVATPLNEKREDGHTHSWTLFLQSLEGEDMPYIHQVSCQAVNYHDFETIFTIKSLVFLVKIVLLHRIVRL